MGIIAPIVGIPGVRAAKTAAHKVIFKGGVEGFLPGGKLIDGNASRDSSNVGEETNLQAGLIMGKIAATGLYAPSVLGVTTVAVLAGATTITMSVAAATELLRRVGASGTFKITGPPVASGTVVTETITYSSGVASTGVITCTATVGAYIIGSYIQPTDGSELPVCPLPDGWPLPVANLDGTIQSIIQFPLLPTDGQLDVTQVINYPTDPSMILWLKARLNGAGGAFYSFSDHY